MTYDEQVRDYNGRTHHIERRPGQQFEEPCVGELFELTPTVWIVPSYVRLSEKPTADGGCVTANLIPGETLHAAGWYVEYRYLGFSEQHRTFVPFP